MLFITHRLQAYFLKITSGRWPPFTSMHCCKRVWKLPYTRLRRSSIAATSSTMACLSSWIVMIRLQNTRSYRNPHRKKSGTVSSGDRAGQVMSPKREITVPNISRTTAILFRAIWNGVLSSTVPLATNHDKLSRRRDIPIRNVSVDSAPPCTYGFELATYGETGLLQVKRWHHSRRRHWRFWARDFGPVMCNRTLFYSERGMKKRGSCSIWQNNLKM